MPFLAISDSLLGLLDEVQRSGSPPRPAPRLERNERASSGSRRLRQQALDDLRFVGIARKQDEVRVETLEVATHAPA